VGLPEGLLILERHIFTIIAQIYLTLSNNAFNGWWVSL
jgi:hypothetical protein